MKKYRLIFSITFYTILFFLFSTFAMADNNNAKKRVVYRTVTINPGMSGEKIQAIFRKLNSSSNVKVLVKSGRYVYIGSIELRSCRNIKVIGIGKVEFITKFLMADVFSIKNCINISIKNIRMYHLRNKIQPGCEGSVLSIDECSKIKIIGCFLNGCGAEGLYCRDSKEIEVKSCRIFYNTSCGIILINCRDVYIINNKIYNNRRSIKILTSSYVELEGNYIRNN